MKVREFVESSSSTTTFIILMNDSKVCKGDKWEIALSDYADYDLTNWYVADKSHKTVYVECELEEEFQSMKECIDEFFGFIDEMGMSRMI